MKEVENLMEKILEISYNEIKHPFLYSFQEVSDGFDINIRFGTPTLPKSH